MGDLKNDNAVFFGAILPFAITAPPDYLTSLSDTGASMKAGISLAVSDFASDKNPKKGLPPVPGKLESRPVVFVLCTDNASAASTATATTHLAVDVGVPAIVGTAFSTYTRAITSTLATLDTSDVLLLTPRSADLVPADNGGRFTRLAPPEAAQGAALAALAVSREAALRAESGGPGAGTLKVALVYKEDAYGNAVATAVKSSLRFNGASSVAEQKYGNPDTPNYSPQFDSVAFGLVNLRPHLIIAIGTNEVVPGVIAKVENGWQEATYRPSYALSDGVVVRELWDYLGNNDSNDSTRKRILGTLPTGTTTRFNPFSSALTAKFPQQTGIVSGSAAAYDAVYLLAYSAAGLGDKAITGSNLLGGFQLLAAGGGALPASVGPDEIAPTFAKLSGGQAVNLEGASSPLDIDGATHTVTGVTTQVWCIPTSGGHAQQAILSGQTVTPAGVVQGAISAACAQ